MKKMDLKKKKNKPSLYFQIFPNSLKSWEIGIFEVHFHSHLLPLKSSSYSEKMCWGEGWQKTKNFAKEKYNSIHSIFSILLNL